MKKLITLLVFIAATMLLDAQGEADNWFFGRYCGITFNTPDKSPALVWGSQMNADEGCASISDLNGNLLFYTDGTKVWNRDNVLMPNGEGLFGHKSSTQSGVIVKKPSSKKLYYIFTVDRQGGPHGLNYSIVDMTKDKGRGDVISKNNYLHYPVAEKITAVMHNDGKSIWIIAHEWGSNKFLAYLLTKDGLSPLPVVSSVGYVYGVDRMNASGYMKASPDGKYVASAVYWDGVFEILRFDNITGKLSHPIRFQSDKYKYIYGVEFSADASKVYFSKSYDQSSIFQVDLRAGDDNDIKNSITVIASSYSYYTYQALQIAPDKKIYVAKRNKTYLSAINSPNEKGAACQFVENALDLQGMISHAGLPTFNQSFLDLYLEISGETDICEGDSLVLRTTHYDDAVYHWEGPGNISSDSEFIAIPDVDTSYTGYYKVTVTYDEITKSDSVFVRVFEKPVASIVQGDTAYVCNNQSVVLTSNSQGDDLSYIWSTGEQTQSIEVFNEGLYYLVVVNENNCSDTAFVRVINVNVPPVKIIKYGGDKLCEGSSMVLTTDKKYVSYEWSTGESDSAITVDQPGVYWVNVTDEMGCNSSDTILIEQYDINFTHFPDKDFGKIIVGDRIKMTLPFINFGEDSLYVTSISKLLNTPEFQLHYSPSVPAWLKQGDTIWITITFAPLKEGIFADSIGIIIAAPCEVQYAFQVSGYTDEAYSLVWFPDTTGEIGTANYVIPLYGKILTDDTLMLDCIADVSFDAEIFLPDENQPDIVENKIQDGIRHLKIKVSNLEMSSTTRMITGIRGIVLLSSGVHPLNIDNMHWSSDYVHVDTLHGNFQATGVCRPDISKIVLQGENQLTIYPNPANDYISIKDADPKFEIYDILLYDYTGRLIKSFHNLTKIDEMSYRIDIADIPMGTYSLVIDASSGRIYFQLVVLR